jgi:F-box/leucine-rich repeat protein 2/20
MLSALFSQQVTNLSLKLTAAIAKKQSADESASKVPPNFLTQKLQEFLNNDAATDLMHGRTFSMAIDQVEAFVIDDIMDNIDAFGEFQLLQKLQLNQCAGITDAGLMDVLRHTVGLKVLDIASCEHITNSSAVLIGKFFPDLEELNISGCFMITDAGFLHIIDNCFSLKRLNITGCSRITDGQLSGLRDRCTGLTSLSSGGQLVLGPEGILGMITLPCLSFLSMPGASFSEVRVSQQLGAASSLVDLNFSEICNIRDWDVCALFKACISLQTLDLSMCQAISSVAWTTVANNCCQLKVVDMSGSESFGDEHLLNLLANCRMLQEIRATFCKKVTDASVSAIISQGQALTRLELMGSSISIEGAEELRSSMLDTHIIM